MALFYKFQEGGETPKYSLYGEEYNFNDLERRVYNDFNDFISTTKYGKKNHDSVYSAVLNIMNGLKSGRVTFENGSFIDSKGEYHNESKEKDDVYGIAAAWILKNMNLAERITSPMPEPKDKYSSDIMGKYILNTIFNNESPSNEQLLDFLDSDNWLDEDHKSKNNTRRIDILKAAISDALSNFDNIINQYDISDEEKTKLKLYIEQALRALEDNKLDDNEYLALSKAFGGINWRNMMSTDFSTTSGEELQEEDEDVVPLGKKRYKINDDEIEAPEGTSIDDIVDWYIDRLDDNPLDSDSINIYNQPRSISNLAPIRKVENTLNQYSADLLVKTLNDYLMNPNDPGNLINVMFNNIKLEAKKDKVTAEIREPRSLIVEYIYGRLAKLGAVTSLGDTQFIVDNVTSPNHPNMILVVDISQHKYRWVSKYKHPKVRDDIRKLLRNQNSGISFHKRGGSLKFNGGGRVVKGQEGLWDLIPEDSYVDPSKDYNDSLVYVPSLGLLSGDRSIWTYNQSTGKIEANPFTSQTASKHDTQHRYVPTIYKEGIKPTKEGDEYYNYVKENVEANKAYQDFTNALFEKDKEGNLGFSEIGKLWAKDTDKLLPENSEARFFDKDGNLRKKWVTTNNDPYGRKPRTFTNLKEYAEYVRNDQLLGGRHNDYALEGDRYYFIDKNGKKQYISAEEASKYTSEFGENVYNDGIIWHDYKIEAPLQPVEEKPEEKKPEGPISKTDPRNATLKGQGFDWTNLGRTLLPEGLAIGRLAGTIATNNKVFRTLNRSLRPYIKNTYELYSPITGAFGVRLAYNLQAADVYRLANRNTTSDAALNIASQLEANRQANLLLEKGFLADNLEILRTSQEALKRQEDNVARRTEVANANRKSINDTIRERGLLRATRDQSNWNAIDEYLGGIEKRLRTKGQEREASYKQLVEDVAKLQAQNEFDAEMAPYKEELRVWYREHPGESAATNWNKYAAYQEAYKNASIKQANTVYKALAKLYGYKYDPNTYSISGKKGAKLIKRKR